MDAVSEGNDWNRGGDTASTDHVDRVPRTLRNRPVMARLNWPRLARFVRFRSLVSGAAQRECQQLPQIQGIVLFGTIDAFAAGGRPFKVNSA